MKNAARQRWLAVCAVALLPAAVRLLCYPAYPGADDAFIHLAVVEALWEHGTWGINPGQNVNLSTSPLFTVCFAVLRPFASNLLAVGIVLSTAAVAGTVVVTYLLARRLLHSHRESLFVAALSASNIHLWRWGGTFMEVSFACLAVVGVLTLFIEPTPAADSRPFRRRFLSGLALGALVLLRPETGLLGAALFLHDAILRKRDLLRSYFVVGLGMALPIGIYASLAWRVFGSVLPSTFGAKSGSGLMLWNPGVLKSEILVIGSGLCGAWLAVLVAAGWAVSRRDARLDTGPWRRHAVFALFPLLMAAFYYLKMPALQSPSRYLLPLITCLPFLALVAIDSVSPRVAPPGRPFPRHLVMALALIVQLVSALTFNELRIAPVLQRMESEYVATMSEAAARIEEHSAPGDVVLVDADIGVVSWRLAGRRVIADAGALASPELRGQSLAEMIRSSGAKYLLHSLGTADTGPLDEGLPPLVLLWQRSFRSHGVEKPDAIYYTRLYRVDSGG